MLEMREKKRGMTWEREVGEEERREGEREGESENGVESLWKLQNAVYKRGCCHNLTDHPSEKHSQHLIAECEISVQ